jgi:hypothetical protein
MTLHFRDALFGHPLGHNAGGCGIGILGGKAPGRLPDSGLQLPCCL